MIKFGYGSDPDFVEWMKNRYIDLAEEAGRDSPGYSDFEGFAGPEKVEELLKLSEIKTWLTNGPSFVRDLLAHWIYESIDQGDYTPNTEECVTFIQTVQWMFNVRYYMKVDAE
jgi:hypothetical protein